MSCGTVTVKCFLYFFHILHALLGLGLIVVFSKKIMENSDAHPAFVLGVFVGVIVLGALAILLSVLGFAFLLMDSLRLTWIYVYSVIILSVVALTLVSISRERQQEAHLERAWNEGLQSDNLTTFDNMYQRKWSCCGVYGGRDYQDTNLEIPESCYSGIVNVLGRRAFRSGCAEALLQKNDMYGLEMFIGIGMIALCFAFPQIIILRNKKRRARF